MQSSMWVLTTAIVLVSIAVVSEGCSCMPSHPQAHYCNADFVILARVKKEYTLNDTRVYKVRIRKEYKMSQKASVALKSGRLLTAAYDSLCGIRLETQKLYVISGKVLSLKAHINLCGFTEHWERLSKRQRRGLNRMYRQGCGCHIKTCFRKMQGCPKTRDSCVWDTFDHNDNLDCQRMQGICLRSSSNQCTWAKNKQQTACMKNKTTSTLTSTHEPPPTISRWSG